MIYKTIDQMSNLERYRVIRVLRENAKNRINNIYQDVTLNSIFI